MPPKHTSEQDLYEILEVPRDADAAAIKAAWRRLAGAHHPDTFAARAAAHTPTEEQSSDAGSPDGESLGEEHPREECQGEESQIEESNRAEATVHGIAESVPDEHAEPQFAEDTTACAMASDSDHRSQDGIDPRTISYERFLQIQHAYEILGDTVKRKAYDQSLCRLQAKNTGKTFSGEPSDAEFDVDAGQFDSYLSGYRRWNAVLVHDQDGIPAQGLLHTMQTGYALSTLGPRAQALVATLFRAWEVGPWKEFLRVRSLLAAVVILALATSIHVFRSRSSNQRGHTDAATQALVQQSGQSTLGTNLPARTLGKPRFRNHAPPSANHSPRANYAETTTRAIPKQYAVVSDTYQAATPGASTSILIPPSSSEPLSDKVADGLTREVRSENHEDHRPAANTPTIGDTSGNLASSRLPAQLSQYPKMNTAWIAGCIYDKSVYTGVFDARQKPATLRWQHWQSEKAPQALHFPQAFVLQRNGKEQIYLEQADGDTHATLDLRGSSAQLRVTPQNPASIPCHSWYLLHLDIDSSLVGHWLLPYTAQRRGEEPLPTQHFDMRVTHTANGLMGQASARYDVGLSKIQPTITFTFRQDPSRPLGSFTWTSTSHGEGRLNLALLSPHQLALRWEVERPKPGTLQLMSGAAILLKR